jgi:hypothetical protein
MRPTRALGALLRGRPVQDDGRERRLRAQVPRLTGRDGIAKDDRPGGQGEREREQKERSRSLVPEDTPPQILQTRHGNLFGGESGNSGGFRYEEGMNGLQIPEAGDGP